MSAIGIVLLVIVSGQSDEGIENVHTLARGGFLGLPACILSESCSQSDQGNVLNPSTGSTWLRSKTPRMSLE